MAFVRFFGKLGSNSVTRVNFLNNNLHQIANTRVFSSSGYLAAAVQSSPIQKATPTSGRKDPLDTKFSDPIAAFKSKTTFELIRGYVVYMLCSSSFLVENNMKVRIKQGLSEENSRLFILSCQSLNRKLRCKKLSTKQQ